VIPTDEQNDFVAAYYKRLTGSDKEMQLKCAKTWSHWECATCNLIMNASSIARAEQDEWSLAFARIECHYFINKGFFEKDGWILDSIDKIKEIPGFIVQGRYDVVCPATTAYELHKKWKKSILSVIEDAGHSANELGIRSQLIEWMDELRKN
jgi:proline iminopeptidase